MSGRFSSVNQAVMQIPNRIPAATTCSTSYNEQLQQILLQGGPTGAGGGKDPSSAGIVSAALTSPPGGVMRHKCDCLYEIYVRAAEPQQYYREGSY